MRNNHTGVFEGTVKIREESRNKIFSQETLQFLNIILQTVLSVLSAWAFVHIFTTAFGLTISELPFILVSLLISIIMLFLVRGQKIGIVLLIAFLVFAGVILFIKRERVIAECAGLYVSVVEAFTAYYGYAAEVGLDVETSYNVTYVMSCFAFLPIWQVSYSYGKHTYPSLLTIFLLLPLFLCITGGQNPSLIPVAVMAFCILALYFTCMTESINTDHDMTERVRKRIRFILISLAVVVSAVLIAIASRVIFPNIRESFMNASSVYTSHFFRDLLADIPGNPLDISKTGLSEGELQRTGNVVQTGEQAFLFTFEKDNPRATYLRNFAGDTYTGSRWTAAENKLPESVIPDSVTYPSVYTPNVSTAIDAYRNPLLYYQANCLQGIYRTADRENTLYITNRSGGGDYFYLPYAVSGKISAGGSSVSFRIISDQYAVGSGKEATYPVYTPGTIVDVLDLLKGREFSEGLLEPDGDPIICYLDAEALSTLLKEYGTNMTPEELLSSNYSEYIVKTETGQKLHYRLKEPELVSYEDYVFEHDLQLPDSARLRETAEALAEQYGIDTGACEYVKAILAVQNYLSQQCRFYKNPGAIGNDTDFIEEFLFEKKEGYCVHFATAGTILLRYLGVPARYVEGFLLPPCSAGEVQEVTDYNAHAWTEVFIPGYGWYPVEMTPSEGQDERETEESETDPVKPEEPETQADDEADITIEPSNATEVETSYEAGENGEPSDQTRPKRNYGRIILAILLGAILISGVIVALYLWLRIRPFEKLKDGSQSKTYLNIYREIQRRAARKGLRFVIDDPPGKLMEMYPGVDPETLKKVQANAKEAYYSRNELSEDAVNELYDLYALKTFEAKDR